MIKRIVVKAIVIIMLISFVSSEVYACPTIRGFPTSLQNHLVYQPVRLNGNIGIEPLENQRITGWSVDWGDGSKVTKGTGLVVDVMKKDGYSKVGDYTIVITVNWEYYDKKAKVWKPGDPNAVIGNKSASVRIEAELKAITAEKLKAGVKEKVKLEVQTLGYDEKTGGADKPVKDIVINFAITSDPSSKATLSKTSDITKGNGKASTEITLGDKAGDYKVRTSGEYLRGSPIDFTIKAGFGNVGGRVYDRDTNIGIGNVIMVIKDKSYYADTMTSSEPLSLGMYYFLDLIPDRYLIKREHYSGWAPYSQKKNVDVEAFKYTIVNFEMWHIK
jgi:hypothetical protein